MIFGFDIDNTICREKQEGQSYADVEPFPEAVQLLDWLRDEHHTIVLYTARHMKTCNGNQGKVLARQGKVLFDWLEKWEIPYDELHWSKPYVDLMIDDATHQHTDWETTSKAIQDRIQKGPRGQESK